tara:strand:+ start:215 stop:703 length:489 start_codon:yes stop_codon:yes gene_type:complete
MATPTYTLIDSTTLASSASSVTFSSIDQSYGDLVLAIEVSSGSSTARPALRFNGDTGNNYFAVVAVNNTSNTSHTISYLRLETDYSIQNGTLLGSCQIMDYSATNKHKSVLIRNDSPSRGVAGMIAGRWANNSAISSIELLSYGGDFLAGGTVYLYGILKAL